MAQVNKFVSEIYANSIYLMLVGTSKATENLIMVTLSTWLKAHTRTHVIVIVALHP